MSHRILLTGASGYLGGTLLARFKAARLPAHDKLYVLVRTDAQETAVQDYGAEPLRFDIKDESAVSKAVVENKITIVLFMLDAMSAESQLHFINALAEVKKVTGVDTHFMHVCAHLAIPDRTISKAHWYLTDKWGEDLLESRWCAHRSFAV